MIFDLNMMRFFNFILLLNAIIMPLRVANAQEPLCAQVRIEIIQELAFERQAFDARMRIVNGLSSTPITDLAITINVRDESGKDITITSNPNDLDATFFIRVDSLRNVSNVNGTGTVAPSSDAEIHWLLIPTAGASGGLPNGKLYYVGATLTYKLGGQEEEVLVTPDTIFVKPQPQLSLNYFLTKDIRADDPLTVPIEPPEPFVLGVRVKNNGHGIARNVTIESAQPKIVENLLGLLIGFVINESSIDDQPAVPSLLINFGDIGSGKSRVGRWYMETNLAGQFIDFTARFSHSDELGGDLTSLVTGVSTHFHIHDVLVDLPGRDQIRDFLASNDGFIKVYESDGIDTSVTDFSDQATLNYQGQSDGIEIYRLQYPVTAGPSYVSLPDASSGAKEIVQVQRSDGKEIPLENAWFSVSGVGAETRYKINLFDLNGGGIYLLKIKNKAATPRPPVLQFVPDKTTTEGVQVSYLLEASDPNGTIPSITIDSLPSGATFVDRGNGTAIFDWRPSVGQRGTYPLTYRASDGELITARSNIIKVFTAGDSDKDDMADDWEMFYFGNLTQSDGKDDHDQDGVSDKQEYARNSDPTFAGDIPSVPVIISPLNGVQVKILNPFLTVRNSRHGKKAATYDFELYKDSFLTQLVGAAYKVNEGNLQTSWQMPSNLSENTMYFWRARAATDFSVSEWVRGSFFVNVTNDPPAPFQINQPSSGSTVANLSPVLSVKNSNDPEGEIITYGFEVRLNNSQGALVSSISSIAGNSSGTTGWQIPVLLSQDTVYAWRGVATDPGGLKGFTPWATFIPSLSNDAPSAPLPLSPLAGDVVTKSNAELAAQSAFDPEGAPLSYIFEVDTVNSFSSPNLIRSGLISEISGQAKFRADNLVEDQNYYWRVKAFDGELESTWVSSQFYINAQNQPPSTPTIDNPGMGSWVALRTPTLILNASIDPDNEPLTYVMEIYLDQELTLPVQSISSGLTSWRIQNPLLDNTRYYWRARAEDSHGAKSAWSQTFNFFVNQDNINDPPTLNLIPIGISSQSTDNFIQIRWSDADPDSNANIALYVNERLIAAEIPEDPDDEGDTYIWNLSGVEPGQYQIKAIISDEETSIEALGDLITVVSSSGELKDRDGDGVPDKEDNCPYIANTDQKDRGGLLAKKKDGVGDACQCGDVNGDGVVNSKDSNLIRKALKKGAKVKVKRLDLCHVGGSKGCTTKDAAIIEKQLSKYKSYLSKKKKGSEPRLPQVCGPSDP